ncbi:MAG: hypothetical protein ACHREM_30125 [Polyangiales bacterium]
MLPSARLRGLARLALAGLGVCGCAPPSAPSAKAMTLAVTSTKSIEAIPFEIAIGAGYLRDEGMTLTLVELPTREAMTRMKAGTIDAAVVSAVPMEALDHELFFAEAIVTRAPDAILIERSNSDVERSVALVRALERAQHLVHDERAEALHAARAGSDEIDPLTLTQRLDAAIPLLPMSAAIDDRDKLGFGVHKEIATRAASEMALGQRRRRYWTGLTISLSLAIGAAMLAFMAKLIATNPRPKDEPET